jgi:hypothetical protein
VKGTNLLEIVGTRFIVLHDTIDAFVSNNIDLDMDDYEKEKKHYAPLHEMGDLLLGIVKKTELGKLLNYSEVRTIASIHTMSFSMAYMEFKELESKTKTTIDSFKAYLKDSAYDEDNHLNAMHYLLYSTKLEESIEQIQRELFGKSFVDFSTN